MKIAEIIAKQNKFDSIAVISAIGTRGYYKKLGYDLKGTYMIKNISKPNILKNSISNWNNNYEISKKYFYRNSQLIIIFIMFLLAIYFVNYYIC